jgi:fatty-acyl-CoA synthase
MRLFWSIVRAAPRSIGLGEATLPAPNAAALLRRNATDPDVRDRPAVRFGDEAWTHRVYLDESARWANLFLAHRDPARPFHVGALLDNVPSYLFALGGAALSGAALVGLNPTRVGEHLLRDITHTDCRLVVTEAGHLDALAPIGDQLACPVLVLGDSLDAALAEMPSDDPGLDPDPATTWALIFTSGTSAAPKAVICSQRRLLQTGSRLAMVMGVGAEDTGYICMPLFHSNAVMVGWAPALTQGATVALARRFSASGFLPDVRRYAATYFCYTGKPLAYLLATPEQPDDADNTLRVAYGNEGSPRVVAGFARRFGVQVMDVFGATEGGVGVERVDDPPGGAVGRAPDHVKVVDEDGHERERARFEPGTGRLVNAEACVGEIVNIAGVGVFEGYYANDEANRRATRFGWYWSGDLGYLDDDGFLYFAGRDAEWIRVDGENFPAGPIETALARHPDVRLVAVYGVPDAQAGDQVMACLVLREEGAFDPAGFARWVDDQPDLGPKWRPRYVRLSAEMPTTASNKILKRTLVGQKFRADRVAEDPVWVRPRGDDRYRPFTADAEQALHAAFVDQGRERFWNL